MIARVEYRGCVFSNKSQHGTKKKRAFIEGVYLWRVHLWRVDCTTLIAPFLKRINIRSLAQCVTPDGKSLLPFHNIAEIYTPHVKIGRSPKWYSFLSEVVLDNTSSMPLSLKSEYIIPSDDVLNRNIYPSPIPHTYTQDDVGKLWLTSWHAPSDSVKFGRLTVTPSLHNSNIIIVHWISDLLISPHHLLNRFTNLLISD